MYNKKVLSNAVKNLDSAKTPSKKQDKVVNNKLLPFISNEGYKQGPPPKGTHYRIPSADIYNPTPYDITAVASTGEERFIPAGDTTNQHFNGAEYVDEFPITKYYQTGGELYTLDGVDYMKQNGKWFKKVNNEFVPLTKGDVAKRVAYLEANAKPNQEQRWEKLYAPALDRVLDTDDEAFYTNLENNPGVLNWLSYMSDSPDKDDAKRNLPPLDPVLAQMQAKIKNFNDKDLVNLSGINWTSLGVTAIPKILSNLPHNVNAAEAWKYINHIKKLKAAGYTLQDGGSIELDLTDEEIEEYKKGGYIVEDISVPSLTRAQDGLNNVSQNKDLNLEEVTVYGDEGKRKLQGNLMDKFNQVKGAYQDWRTSAGLRQAQLRNEGASSIEALKAQISDYRKQLDEEKKTYAKANKALNILQKLDSDNWKNAKLNDVLSTKGIEGLRSLYSEGKLTEGAFRDFYNNFGSEYDPNVIEGTGPNRAYSAKEARENWMEHVPEFANAVSKFALAAPLAGGAGALATAPGYIPSLYGGNGLMSAIGTGLNTAIAGVPGLTTNNLLWGAGAYLSGDQIIDPKSETRTSINKAIQNPTASNIVDATGNTLLTGLGFAGIPVKSGLTSFADDVSRGTKYLTTQYDNIATGNSRLTDFGLRAWKSPAMGLSSEKSRSIYDKILNSSAFTDAEKALVREYQYSSFPFIKEGAKQNQFNALIQKASAQFPENAVITRKFYGENPQAAFQSVKGTPGKYTEFSIQDRPSAFSAGIGSDANWGKDRVVMSGKNLKKVEGNFVKNTYEPVPEEYYANLSDDALTVVDNSKRVKDNYSFNEKIGDNYYGTSRLTPEEIQGQAEALYQKRVADFNSPENSGFIKPNKVEDYVGKSKDGSLNNTFTQKEAEEIVAKQTEIYNQRQKLYGNPANKDEAIESIIKENKGSYSNNPEVLDEKELIGSGFDMKVVGRVKNELGGIDYIVKPFNLGKKAYRDGGLTRAQIGSSKERFQDGGMNNDYIEIELTPEEIQAYKDGGYIVEDLDKLYKFIY